MATLFLSGLDNARYRALLNDMHNAFRMGHNEYPKTLTSTYELAINWKGDSKGFGVTPNDGVAFTTMADEVDVHAMDHTWAPCGHDWSCIISDWSEGPFF